MEELHAGNNSKDQCLWDHLLNKDQLVCIPIYSQRRDPYALTLGERVAQLLGSSLAHSPTEAQYSGPPGKQTWQVAGFDYMVAFLQVKAVVADHLVNLVKNDNSTVQGLHFQEVV